MSEESVRRAALAPAVALVVAGLLGLLLALALAILSQPSLAEFEKTLDVMSPRVIKARELVEGARLVRYVHVVIVNEGDAELVVEYRGARRVLGPRESLSLELESLEDELWLSGEREVKARVSARVSVYEGGSLALSILAALVFIVSATLALAGAALAFSIISGRLG
ncbi:MAG: hypothetical protein QXS85_05800 [Acidilobaceae archaeon]